MTDFYYYWLTLGKSNSEQAAFIFNCKDPRLYDTKIKFPVKNNDFSGVKPNTWQWDVLETYFIFESAVTADWEKCFDIEADYYFWFRHPRETSPSHFYSLAQDKGISIPALLENASLQLLKRQSENDYRKSMAAALKVYKKGGINQQGKSGKSSLVEDDHKLSVFRVMENLSFEEVTIRINRNLTITIMARNQESSISFIDLDLTKNNKISLNAQGEAIREMATDTFDPSVTKNQKRVVRLSEVLRRNLRAKDSPFKYNLPRFRIYLAEDKSAKQRGIKRTVSYNDSLEAPEDLATIKTPEAELITDQDAITDEWLKNNDTGHGVDD